MAGVGRQFPYPSLKKPDGQFGGNGSLIISSTHTPLDLCFPEEHPEDDGSPPIGIGDGLV